MVQGMVNLLGWEREEVSFLFLWEGDGDTGGRQGGEGGIEGKGWTKGRDRGPRETYRTIPATHCPRLAP